MRYSKQIKLPEFGKEAQQKLSKASVLVIGAGGLGCPVLMYLAAAGIGKIGIADFDIIEESNLPRQPLYIHEDIGRLKVERAAYRLRKMNPEIVIEVYAQKLQENNASSIIEKYDIIADCTDNFTARYLINDTCVRLNKPWVFASIEGWEGQASVFNYTDKDNKQGPTYRCLFPEPPLDSASCDDIGIIGSIAAITGSMQANEIIKCISGSGTVLSGKLWIANLLNNQFSELHFHRNETEINSIKAKVISPKKSETNIEIPKSTPINSSELIVIDIRERHEFEAEPSKGINMPFDELMKNINFFQKSKNYLLVCNEGKKSLFLAYHLKEKYGMGNIQSLDGGWKMLK